MFHKIIKHQPSLRCDRNFAGAFFVDKRDRGARLCVGNVKNGSHLLCERLDDSSAQSRLGPIRAERNPNAVVAHRKRPVWTLRVEIDRDDAAPMFGESMLKRIDHEFRDDQTHAHRDVGGDHAVIDGHPYRQLFGIIEAARLSQSSSR